MKKWLRAADEFLFGWGSPVTMGVFRIVIGALSFIDLLMISLDFTTWFGDKGLYPQWMAERWGGDIPRFSLLGGVTDDRTTAVVYAVITLVAFMTCIGLFSRVSSILLFIGIVTLHHRSPDILHSGDTLLRAWCFILMLMPSGLACSVDRLIAKKRGTAPESPPLVSLWPQRLAQIQLAIVYFSTVWIKWGGITWRDGTATYYPPFLHEFDKFPVPAFVNQPPMIYVTTYATLIVELALATLVFSKPLRKWCLILGLMLHGWIEYSMNVPLFQWVIVSGFIAHYEGDEISAWAKRLAPRLGKLGRLIAPSEPEIPAHAAQS